MALDLWFAFIVATAIITLVPGPCVLLLVGQALSRGLNAAFAGLLGVLIGDVLLILCSLMGLGALLATSETLFQVVKWAGVLYLAYLGYCQIAEARKHMRQLPEERQPRHAWACFRAGFISAALNAKGIVFFLAFLPQFMEPGGDPMVQIVALLATSTVVVACILGLYVLAASAMRRLLTAARSRRYINYLSGGCLMGGSVMMAMARSA